ncbi:hypothetical protein I546_0001 [Mycobacterium kansasii 732]|nr:hypothetical protein I546_0001 [Mycobacterium kansasii 732]
MDVGQRLHRRAGRGGDRTVQRSGGEHASGAPLPGRCAAGGLNPSPEGRM